MKCVTLLGVFIADCTLLLMVTACSSLTLFIGRQEMHPPCKKTVFHVFSITERSCTQQAKFTFLWQLLLINCDNSWLRAPGTRDWPRPLAHMRLYSQ